MPRVPDNILVRTPVMRMVHVDCLDTLLRRDALHAPSAVPADGLAYHGIHAEDVQLSRASKAVPCGPGGVIRDYVGFYFGPRSPMLYRIQTGHNVVRVPPSDVVYLVAIAQEVAAAGLPFVFTDRHSLTKIAEPYDNLSDLGLVSFRHAYADQWSKTKEEPDRQELKQSEFLVYRSMPWRLIVGVGVFDRAAKERVHLLLSAHPNRNRPPLRIRRDWYY